jgi:hypothetical protein
VTAEIVTENLGESLDALRAQATIVVSEDYAADFNLSLGGALQQATCLAQPCPNRRKYKGCFSPN